MHRQPRAVRLQLLGQRAGPECVLLFVDTSRPGKRRWCSSTACGGKERAAAYRRRKRTEPEGGGPEA